MALKPVERQVASFSALAQRYSSFQQLPASLLPVDAKTASDATWLAWAHSGGLCALVESALEQSDIEVDGDVDELQGRVSARLEASDRTRTAVIAALMDLIDDLPAIIADVRADDEPDTYALGYEDWFGYEKGLRGHERAVNKEGSLVEMRALRVAQDSPADKQGGREDMAESAAYHEWKNEGEAAAAIVESDLIALGQLIKDPGAGDAVNALVARRRVELTTTLARYPGNLSVDDAMYPSGIARMGYHDYVRHVDDATVGPLRDALVREILQYKYTTGNAKTYFDALLSYKADAAKTEPIELGSSKNPKARRYMRDCIAAVDLESGVAADGVTVLAGKSKIGRLDAPDKKFIRGIPGVQRHREQLVAFKADATQTTLDLASSTDNRLRAQLHELVRDVGGLSSASRVDPGTGGRSKTVVVTKLAS